MLPDAYDPEGAPLPDDGLFGLPFSLADARLVIVPVPWDVTTSYRAGTARGPDAVRRASHQLDLFDAELGEPWRAGIAMLDLPAEVLARGAAARLDAERVIAVGGRIGDDADLTAALSRVNAAGAWLNDHVYAEVDRLLAQGKLVGLVGGDHSVPFGAIARLAEAHPGLGILHVDAHCDLRVAYEGFTWSHASIMHNVLLRVPQVGRLVQVGVRDYAKSEADAIAASAGRVVAFPDAALAARAFAGETWAATCRDIVAALPDQVYVSFDIDGLDPVLCPSTGTPVPGGLTYAQATYLLGALTRAGKRVVGFDLNEVAPGPDGDEWDANVGARVLYQLCGRLLASAT